MELISLTSFLVVVLAALTFYLLPKEARSYFLIIGSGACYYLVAGWGMILVQYSIILSTYLIGKQLIGMNEGTARRVLFYLGCGLSLLPILFFKSILAFFPLAAAHDLMHTIFIPIGISYYVFMGIGFLIDVYYEELDDLPKLQYYAAFIGFFPLTLSGPIERTNNFLKQLVEDTTVDNDTVKAALRLILWGCFMKLVVADRVGIYVDAVFNNIERHSAPTLTLASLLYPFQVYGDLGGYTLIVRGVSLLFGYKILQNFHNPFMAHSIADFWRRWHMSLINWLRDYVYTPLSFYFRGYGTKGAVMALIITFLLSGIWHDFEAKYLLWGAFHAFLLSVELTVFKRNFGSNDTNNASGRLLKTILRAGWVYILFAISQIFVCVKDLSELVLFAERMTIMGPIFVDKTTMAYSVFGILVLLGRDVLSEYRLKPRWSQKDWWVIMEFVFLFFSITLFGIINHTSFIYFKF